MSQQASEYFLSALEAQRSINTHIHEIEPTTPIMLYEIDLNEIKPATITYPTVNGPIRDGVLRIHNDFNLFNINRGIIKWKGNYYYPFPVFGEQFDITSNGTIPTPKVKFSSQFLDDEYNSFYKYVRMQINELKDIVGAKVTRRKTFVRYLSPDNFAGNVNPFNEFAQAPWASRDGDTLTVRAITPIPPPPSMAKWLIYYPKPNYGAKNKIFTSIFTDDRLRSLGIELQQQNYAIESTDFVSLLLNENIESSNLIDNYFSVNVFAISGGASSYSNIIPDYNKEFTLINDTGKLKVFCNSVNVNTTNITGITGQSIAYPLTFSENDSNIVSFLSIKSNVDSVGKNINYNIQNQYDTGINVNFSDVISGNFDFNYLSLKTGYYTGINPYSKEQTKFAALRIENNFSTNTSGDLNIVFPFSFSNVPKILFNASSESGFIFDQYLQNITSTGLTLTATNTGANSFHLGIQKFNVIVTDYLYEDLTPTGASQIFSSQANLATEYKDQMISQNLESYETELTPDIFYIDRKVQEDSTNAVYELASLLDVEGVKLPSRVLLSKNCPFTYRGEGCLYEYSNRLTPIHSGVYGEVSLDCSPTDDVVTNKSISLFQKAAGLLSAPPVADSNDNPFTGAINQTNWIDKGAWGQGIGYQKNNFVHIEKNEIKYYFICTQDHTGNAVNAPPNESYWLSDICSKTLKGCRLRWKENPNFPEKTFYGSYNYSAYSTAAGQNINIVDNLISYYIQSPKDANGNQLIGVLPFGGFPSVEGKYQSQQGPQSS